MPDHVDAGDGYALDLAYCYDLSLPQARRLAALAVHSLVPALEPGSPAFLADPAVAEAFVSSPLGLGVDDESVERLERVARRAVDGGFDTAGARFALASVAEHRGDVDAQRSHLADSLALDGSFAPSRLALGFLAFVEGDPGRAGMLLAGIDDARAGTMRHALTHVPPLAVPAGRNDPCPCGSGRKSKHCCPTVPRQPLEQRVHWLWGKAEQWLRRLPQLRPEVELAGRLAGVDVDGDGFEDVLDTLAEADFRALALLEGGMLSRFLDRYGELLPGDELALADEWCAVRHRIWHVQDTEPGWWLRLADLATGQVVQASNGSVSRCTLPGEVFYGAVVPNGEGWLLPAHPICLDPDAADAVVELVAAGIDPLAVAATVYRGLQGATT